MVRPPRRQTYGAQKKGALSGAPFFVKRTSSYLRFIDKKNSSLVLVVFSLSNTLVSVALRGTHAITWHVALMYLWLHRFITRHTASLISGMTVVPAGATGS